MPNDPASADLLALSRPPAVRLGPWGSAVLPLLGGLERGRLTLVDPFGAVRVFDGRRPGPQATVRIADAAALHRLVTGGSVGFAEAYMDGLWDSPGLTALIELAAVNTDLDDRLEGRWTTRAMNRVLHLLRGNTKRGSRRNIAYHYDLGNGFYRRWLDPTMTYSAAVFETPDQDLTAAQVAKYERLAALLHVGPGNRVLEIGCGWGGFARHLATTRGCHVTGITLSTEQLTWAQEMAQREGLADRLEFRLQDYRDVPETYDAVASIEMFEAVGEEHWPVYFRTLHDRLKPGGHGALQVITIAEDRFDRYRRGADFIQRYIFPGGMLPSPSRMRQGLADAGLSLTHEAEYGSHYAETLRRWQQDFQREWPAIRASEGFDERFHRMWTYYLAYCEAGFRAGTIDVVHFGLTRP
ncbi:SAM-dependent methyltransferase [Caenispirillum bisanense]|uniref:Cyclopropane-fatty-acyl-phospholipid synthase n=1 Tax=Caenispirillum bisanense TaxID=414052 RepID=A0A286G5P3_9PROT|nr:cyclopropane-fatty-acyl-phospholipid synthase family protein [Caenispirillum bisanense]SOD90304.1 cyclopropane-fatty-acyl-phospholipid synthase [Caenispirillum bisanense]